ncbi:probable trehalose-phosphate phosphatase C [Drosophila grimshawi]|uniref:Trehalose 6-phosphate phosphatase n=1 Tax=Drosophila grimshawi TaxID=7222 RepID=B4JQP2_DROGR|nr:probable trehalose-phosphate phosphatase C [Drosophila grimshawi]EDV99222.1 GH13732 [Drosophila grimshawi]
MPERQIPPVISRLEEFEQHLPGYLGTHLKLAILLDYDGTLAPIADNPNKTKIPSELEAILHKLAKHPQIFLSVISGRALKDVQAQVNIDGVTYAGNHGLEIEHPDGSRHDYELPADIKKNYMAMVEELKQRLEKNGAWVEDKRVSLTYHYRDTPVALKDEQKKLAIEICQRHGFHANQAHEAIEAKPPVNWNKGEAALHILNKKFGDDWSKEVLVVFAGDDTTDEDAMRVLKGLGRSFRIADDAQVETFADFRLPKQDLMTDLLRWIASAYVSEI